MGSQPGGPQVCRLAGPEIRGLDYGDYQPAPESVVREVSRQRNGNDDAGTAITGTQPVQDLKTASFCQAVPLSFPVS